MRLLIRADGNPDIGTGHVMRMLALAEHALALGAKVTLASARLAAPLAARARGIGVAVLGVQDVAPGSPSDVEWLLPHAAQDPDTWVCVDGYAFDHHYQNRIAQSGVRCLWVDDYGGSEYYGAALVLNHQIYADPALYAAHDIQTKLLLGPNYVPLRREFSDADRRAPDPAPRARRILLTMGGADPVNATALVAEALCRIDDPELQVRALVGPSNPRSDELERRFTDSRVQWLRGTSNMVGLLRWADLALAAAGTTTYELCYMGVPAMLLVLAENQLEVCEAAGRHGVAEPLGWHHAWSPASLSERIDALRVDPSSRLRMTERGQALVDGRGAGRILEAMDAVRPSKH